MKVSDVYNYINSFAPFSSAEKWDNSGLLIGDGDTEITKAVVCLDVTDSVIDFSIKTGAELIVSHHPVIFSPLHCVTADSVVYRAVRSGISIISAHTNLDKAVDGVNDALCEILSFDYSKMYAEDNSPTFINVCTADRELTPDSFADFLKDRLSCCVSYVIGSEKIGKIALCTGSGADFIDAAVFCGCNAFITGEASYHKFLYAKEKGISLFAVGHFESEIPVVKKLTEKLNSQFNCTAFVEADSQNSVITVK